MRPAEIGPDEAMEVWLACLCGDAEVALELERLGIADEDDSLEVAGALRPMILEIVEATIERFRP